MRALQKISNVTYDQIAVGDSASLERVVTQVSIDILAVLSGDIDPFLLDGNDGSPPRSDVRTTDAAGAAALIAAILGTKLPGPGTRLRRQQLEFLGDIRVGDRLSATVTVREKCDADHSIRFDCRCVNQLDETLVQGSVTVEAPTRRAVFSDITPPDLVLRRGDGLSKLLRACEGLQAVRTAIVHPCDRDSLLGPLEAARRALIEPVLVGPRDKIRRVAESEGADLAGIEIVTVPHSHAAAEKAVELARSGDVEALMKGSLHTDELLSPVVATDSGLRTSRRISHVFVLDVPSYPRPLFISDAAINIYPDLAVKIDIVQNAIDLAQVLGIEQPKVAILSAVETVNPNISSTLEAAALCKMAERRQIRGGVIDGPLAFDNAVSVEAARTKQIESPVAGKADILIVPDVESGNMLAKQLCYMAGAEAAGILMGTRVPVVLTSRADSIRSRLGSAALMVLVAEARRTGKASW